MLKAISLEDKISNRRDCWYFWMYYFIPENPNFPILSSHKHISNHQGIPKTIYNTSDVKMFEHHHIQKCLSGKCSCLQINDPAVAKTHHCRNGCPPELGHICSNDKENIFNLFLLLTIYVFFLPFSGLFILFG